MIAEGNVAWVFPDNFDVDDIIGATNISLQKVEDIQKVLMKEFDPDFLDHVKPGDILVAGINCGYGHAHPQPMTGMRSIGIDTLIAASFTFPFYRSELASGMKMLICPDITKYVKKGDHLKVDLDTLEVMVNGKTVTHLNPIAEYPRSQMENGGAVGNLKKNLL